MKKQVEISDQALWESFNMLSASPEREWFAMNSPGTTFSNDITER